MLRIMSYPIHIMKKLIGGNMDFSLEEKVVGTWIDGKPLYQRAFQGNVANGLVLDDSGTIENLICQFGYCNYDSTHPSHILPLTSTNNLFVDVTSTNNLQLRNSGWGNNRPFVFVCMYTKTID